MRPDAAIRAVTARAYTIPTDAPEADGTFAWRETTLVVATIEAGGETGLGYTYSSSRGRARWRRPARRRSERAGCVRHTALSPIDGQPGAQHGPLRLGRDRDLRARCGALGSEGEAHGSAARGFARPGARDRSDLRQRRLHLLQRSRAQAASLPAGSSGTAVAR